ncbi:hypothetical protein D3C76_1125200 [compost metagenome]
MGGAYLHVRSFDIYLQRFWENGASMPVEFLVSNDGFYTQCFQGCRLIRIRNRDGALARAKC